MLSGLRHVLRLMIDPCFQRHGLVGADHQRVAEMAGDVARLCLRQRERYSFGCHTGFFEWLFQRTFIDLGCLRLENEAGIFQERTSKRACRGQDERKIHHAGSRIVRFGSSADADAGQRLPPRFPRSNGG
ncbi:hypothetical protein D9M72_315300 [compost metagenome]